MGRSSTSAAICKVCEHEHRLGDPHIWGNGSKPSKKANVIKDLKESIVNGRSSSTVEHLPCKREVSGSIPESGSKKPYIKPVLKRYVRAPLDMANGMANNESMANGMANTPDVLGGPLPGGEGSVSGVYKYRDAEKRKTYQRDLMRKRRAKT